MTPVDFQLHSPARLEEALALLEELGEEAVVLAGGQSLMPLLNMRLVRPGHVVDLSRLRELAFVRASQGGLQGGLEVGAMTRQRELAESADALRAAPLLVEATRHVGQPHTRSRGTVGGSVALGSNVSEICCALLALDGRVVLQSTRGERTLAADRLFKDYLETELKPGELVTRIEVPSAAAAAGTGFAELKLRACDFPIVIAAAALEVDGAGNCRSARVALGGVASTPVRSLPAEAALAGRPLTDGVIGEAVAAAAAALSPPSDVHAPGDYRRRVAGLQLRAALERARRRSSHEAA